MPGISTLAVYLTANTKQFKSGMSRAQKSLKGFENSANAVVKGGLLALGAGAIYAGGKLISLGSDLEETTNKFNTVFSNLPTESKKATDELVKNFGFAEKSAIDLLGSTGDLLTGFGFTQKQALKLSNSVQELSVDLASFQNLKGGAKEASTRLTKALLGETESAKSLGIVIRQNTDEFRKQVKELQTSKNLTETQAKAMIILAQATEQSKNAIGDFAKTQDQFANASRVLNERLSGVADQLGIIVLRSNSLGGEMSKSSDSILEFTNDLKRNTDGWVFFIKSYVIEVKFGIKQAIAFFKSYVDNIAIFMSNSFEIVMVTTDNIVNVFKATFKNIGLFAGALANEIVNLFGNIGDSIASFISNPLGGFNFSNIGENIGKNLDDVFNKYLKDVEIFKVPSLVEYKSFADGVLDIEKQKQKVLDDEFKRIEDSRNKATEATRKKLIGKTKADDSLKSITTSKTQFAGALEKGTAAAFSAEIKRGGQGGLETNTKDTANNTAKIADILRKTASGVRMISLDSPMGAI